MTTIAENLLNDAPNQPVTYSSYLVRFWRTEQGDTWRASAQHVQTGTIVRFADLASLLLYLEQQTMAGAVHLAEALQATQSE